MSSLYIQEFYIQEHFSKQIQATSPKAIWSQSQRKLPKEIISIISQTGVEHLGIKKFPIRQISKRSQIIPSKK
ncbi:unnamed protein product [Paramecium octaurelia]|uniref:Uncharacterized protein n=1 Tax=Paramecium octaurelia TaxID=43137 RepID=A0A8S1XK62_PAROT|nr:unnamed protein product [Paramecium octaurelia]